MFDSISNAFFHLGLNHSKSLNNSENTKEEENRFGKNVSQVNFPN